MNRCVIGDCRDTLKTIPDGTFQTCVTSPPYWGLRDYGHADQIGLESSPDEYVAQMVAVFREVRRTLRDDGTLWLNLGDSYAGAGNGGQGKNSEFVTRKAARCGVRELKRSKVVGDLKSKDLVGIPWEVAFALRADGWYLRMDIIWHKPNPMPESVKDRPTKAHEYLFLMSKSPDYFYDDEAIAEPTVWADGETRNARSVWTMVNKPYPGAHFATMSEEMAQRAILAGSSTAYDGYDTVLDPFFGSGTVGQVAERLGRRWFGCELNPEYEQLIRERTAQTGLAL
jgi:DNA modification methylase